ncbi:MAG: hypothetical protein AB1352_02875 [Patescibacteria group bacterium]
MRDEKTRRETEYWTQKSQRLAEKRGWNTPEDFKRISGELAIETKKIIDVWSTRGYYDIQTYEATSEKDDATSMFDSSSANLLEIINYFCPQGIEHWPKNKDEYKYYLQLQDYFNRQVTAYKEGLVILKNDLQSIVAWAKDITARLAAHDFIAAKSGDAMKEAIEMNYRIILQQFLPPFDIPFNREIAQKDYKRDKLLPMKEILIGNVWKEWKYRVRKAQQMVSQNLEDFEPETQLTVNAIFNLAKKIFGKEIKFKRHHSYYDYNYQEDYEYDSIYEP